MRDRERKPPPSAEEEALWRKRFGMFALLRLSGLLMMLGGIMIGLTDVVRPGGWPLVGGVLGLVGFIDGIVLPRLLRRRWEPK